MEAEIRVVCFVASRAERVFSPLCSWGAKWGESVIQARGIESQQCRAEVQVEKSSNFVSNQPEVRWADGLRAERVGN